MIRERVAKASEKTEQMLLIGMCKDYTNFNKVRRYIGAEDFGTEEFKTVYTSIKSLYESSGFKAINEHTVETYSLDKNLSENEKMRLKTFVSLGSNIEVDFDGTYNQFRRNSGMLKFIRESEKFGSIDNMIYDMYNKTESADDLKAEMDNLNKVCFKAYKSSIKTASLAEGMVDYVKNEMFAKDGRSIDFLKMPLIQNYSKGIHVGVSFVLGQSGAGKSIKMDAKLYTANGEILMKDVKVGDRIFGEDGKLHNVIGVYPQGKKQVVRVTFSDHTHIDCCEDHLWGVKKHSTKPRNISIAKGATAEQMESAWRIDTMSTKEIFESGVKRKGVDKTKGDNRDMFMSKYRIPLTKPVEFEKKDHIISPYLLGVLIGDGSLGGTVVSVSTNEQYVVDRVREEISHLNMNVKKNNGYNYSYNITNNSYNKPNVIKREAERLKLNVRSHEKFIPNEYKFDSVENRLALLRGIFDTDGHVTGARKIITTISTELKDDIVWICQSLGMTATVTEDTRDKYVNNDRCYNIHIQSSEDMLPFTSPKHKDRYSAPKRYKYVRRHIESIEYLDEYVEMQCISVDNPTKLYLTDNFTVTHNTSLTIPLFAMPMLESGQKVLTIHNEQEMNEIKQLYLMSYISRVKGNKTKLHRESFNSMNMHKITKEQMDELLECAKEFEERYKDRLEFVFVPRFNADDLEALILDYSRKGYENVILDTFKQEDSTDGWAGMDLLANKVDGISKELGLKIVCTAQLAGHMSWRKYLDVSVIGKSKAIKEVATSMYMFRWLHPEEIPNITYSYWVRNAEGKPIWTNGLKLDTHYTDSYGNKHDKKYLAVFNDKQRRGQSGNVVIYEGDLGGLNFREIGATTSIKNDSSGK